MDFGSYDPSKEGKGKGCHITGAITETLLNQALWVSELCYVMVIKPFFLSACLKNLKKFALKVACCSSYKQPKMVPLISWY